MPRVRASGGSTSALRSARWLGSAPGGAGEPASIESVEICGRRPGLLRPGAGWASATRRAAGMWGNRRRPGWFAERAVPRGPQRVPLAVSLRRAVRPGWARSSSRPSAGATSGILAADRASRLSAQFPAPLRGCRLPSPCGGPCIPAGRAVPRTPQGVPPGVSLGRTVRRGWARGSSRPSGGCHPGCPCGGRCVVAGRAARWGCRSGVGCVRRGGGCSGRSRRRFRAWGAGAPPGGWRRRPPRRRGGGSRGRHRPGRTTSGAYWPRRPTPARSR